MTKRPDRPRPQPARSLPVPPGRGPVHESLYVCRESVRQTAPIAHSTNLAPLCRDPALLRESRSTTPGLPRCVRPGPPCNRQRDLLALGRGVESFLLAARGDGARLCPPKAQPSPPPRDLVQRPKLK